MMIRPGFVKHYTSTLTEHFFEAVLGKGGEVRRRGSDSSRQYSSRVLV